MLAHDLAWTLRTERPEPPSTADGDRMRVMGLLVAMLTGAWKPQLEAHIRAQLGPLRGKLVGKADISANLFDSTITQISCRFDHEPLMRSKTLDPAHLAVIRDELMSEWWPLAPEHERFVRGLHESLVAVSWDLDDDLPTFRLVTPDHVFLRAAASNPRRIAVLGEARERPVPGKPDERAWFWDVWDIRDRNNPSFRILTNDLKRDVTRELGVNPAEWTGRTYPYRIGKRPVIPFGMHHARPVGGLWSPLTTHSEISFGTLQVGLLWTATVHGFLRASWAQNWISNGRVVGGTVEKVEGRNVRLVTPDPTRWLEVKGEGASIGQLGASIDIEKAEGVTRRYESRLYVHAGLSPADLVIESLNPASGASISVSQKGKRELQRKGTPAWLRGDRRLVAVTVAVARGRSERFRSLPEVTPRDTTMIYRGAALTPEERVQVDSYGVVERKHGVMSRVGHYQELHPGVDEDQARADLKVIDTQEEQDQVMAGEPGAGAPADDKAAQDTALNGAQVAAAQGIIDAVAQGRLPRESGVAMLSEFFNLGANVAERVLGEVGRGFVPTAPPPAPQGAQPQPSDEDAPETE